MAAKEIIIPPLSEEAEKLKSLLTLELALLRLNQIDGVKFETKEYKRTKDYKFKITPSKTKTADPIFNLSEASPEYNSFLSEADATFGLLAHIGYTPEMEANYQNALNNRQDRASKITIYSEHENQSFIGQKGVPIKEEYTPGLSFSQMIRGESFESIGKEKSFFAGKSFSDFLEVGNSIALHAIEDFKANKARELAEAERLEAEKNKKETPTTKADKDETKKKTTKVKKSL